MTSIELKPGDRVRLNELGASRSPKIKVRTGVVVAFSGSVRSWSAQFEEPCLLNFCRKGDRLPAFNTSV